MFDTQKLYDANASKWLRMEPSSLSDFTGRPAVFDACGDLNGESVLDIGCGEGYCARELKRRGAGEYFGIDLSAEMINAAKSQEAKDPLGIDYQACDVLAFKTNQSYDLCIAVFLFNYLDIEAMENVFATVYQALKPKGRFIFSVPHPFFPFVNSKQQAPFYFDAQGKNYFSDVNKQFEGKIWKRNGAPLPVQCVHKTFGDYFQSLQKSGFTKLPEVKELTVTPELAATDEEFFGPLLNQPLHVLFHITK